MRDLAILFAGFSLFAIFPVGIPLWRGTEGTARWAGICLILSLAGLQWFHFSYLQDPAAQLNTPVYKVLLFSVAPLFYLYSRPILLGNKGQPGGYALLHLLPVVGAVFFPLHLALPLSFVVGSAYLAWLAAKLYALRAQRDNFQREVALLGGIFVTALLVTLLGFILPPGHFELFFMLYTIAIGLAFMLLSLSFALAPELSEKVQEAARETYANTTLDKIDCSAALQELDNLMTCDRLFRQPDLNLAGLAARLKLNRHQLSELLNTRLGMGFSRYLREQRVKEARLLLLEKPSLPVLSVGLEAGFSSQSAFYDAFREITGMTPGKYRELHKKPLAH